MKATGAIPDGLLGLFRVASSRVWSSRTVTEAVSGRSLHALVVLFVLLAAGVVTGGFVAYRNYEEDYRTQVQHQLAAIADLKVDQLEDWRNERMVDGKFFYRNAIFSELVKRYVTNRSDSVARKGLLAWMEQIQKAYGYDLISLLDARFNKMLIFPQRIERDQSFIGKEAAIAVRSGEMAFQDFYYNEQLHSNFVKALVPMFAEHPDSELIAVLSLRIDPRDLFPMLQKWPTPSKSAETLLLRREGSAVVYLNQFRHREGAAHILRNSLENADDPAVMAAWGRIGLLEGVDNRNESVIAFARPVPGSSWILVTKIDVAEVFGPLRERFWLTIFLVGALIVGTGAMMTLAWRRERNRYYREQYELSGALRASEQRFRETLDNVQLAALLLDPEGRVIFCNKFLLHLLGRSQTDVAGKDWFSFLPEGEKERMRTLHRENLCAEPGHVRFDNPIQTSSGELRHIRWKSTAVHNADGEVTSVVNLGEDVTERKRAEAALQESEDIFSQFMEHSPVYVFFKDHEGRALRLSGNFEEMLGKPLPELLGKTAYDLFPPELAGNIIAADREILRGGKPVVVDEELRGRHYTTIKFPISIGGRPRYLAGYTIDTTERKKVENALSESEARFRQIADNIRDIFFLYEKEGDKLLYMSGVVASVFGVSPAMVEADRQLVEKAVHPDDVHHVKFVRPEFFYSMPLDEEFRVLKPSDGEVRWMRLRSFLIRDERGDVVRVAGLATDITDLRNFQEKARQQQTMLIQADKMVSLGLLVSGVAHEINNPNNLVMLNNDLVSCIVDDVMPVLDEYYESHPDRLIGGLSYFETRNELKRLLKGIDIGSQRIRDIVAGLGEFARTDPGAMNQPVRINDIVKSALLIVAHLVRNATETCSVDYADDLPIAVGNAQQIEQVVINLVTNACHALADRNQAIHISTAYSAGDGTIRIAVSDEGVGIPEAEMKWLFDPFYTTKRDLGGIGLGLPISYSIVQAHKGELQMQSVEGKGTTVTVSLPVRRPEKVS